LLSGATAFAATTVSGTDATTATGVTAAAPGQSVAAGGSGSAVIREVPRATLAPAMPITTPRATPAAAATLTDTGSVRRVDRPEDFGLKGGTYDQVVTIDVNDKPIDAVIRLIGSKGKINILFNPQQVSGNITLHLENVRLGDALDQILRVNRLAYVQEPGNILRIVPSTQVGQQTVELNTVVIPLNWVKAGDLVATLQPFISTQGQIKANAESNSLVVTDSPPAIDTVRELITKLDQPEKQVMLEMHLVDVSEQFTKAHGITWNVFRPDAEAISNGRSLGDAKTPMDILGNTTPINNSAFNWSIGDTINIFGKKYNLTADIQANATNNAAKVLANPRVITLNNLEAKITIQEQIPYIQGTASTGAGGITTEQIVFQPAGQEVAITPTITANGYVRMQINVQQKIFRRRVGSAPLDPPQVDERNATTTAIIQDGKTIVVGGLEGHRMISNREGTPWLMDAPFFRWFFQAKNDTVDKSTLYLFVKPQIIPVSESGLSEREKFWYDGVDREWNMPDEFFDNWNESYK